MDDPSTSSSAASTSALIPSAEPKEDYPAFWTAASDSAAPAVRQARRSLRHGTAAPTLRVARVGQLDAQLLDDELNALLLAPLRSALDTVKAGLSIAWQPELVLALRLALFRFAILRPVAATYGASMQNLRYRNEWAHGSRLSSAAVDAPLSLVQKVMYPLVTAILPYVHSRLSAAAYSSSASPSLGTTTTSFGLDHLAAKTERVTEVLRRTLVIASFLNLSAFLVNGKYRSLADRILGIRLVYANRSAARNVSFEFLNRQLVWQALTEFLVFLLPLLRAKRVIKRVQRIVVSQTTKVKSILGASTSSDSTPEQPVANSLDTHLCPLCWVRSGGPAAQSLQEAHEAHSTPSFSLGYGLSANPLDPSTFASAVAANVGGEEEPEDEKGLTHGDSEAVISLPAHAVPCGCTYDYYCLASALLSEEAADQVGSGASSEGPWPCLRCGRGVRGVVRT